jgi:hypothetical protein
MKKIALWAGIATLVFTGIAQADPIQSTYPWQPGYDPFPAGDTVVSVTLSGTITGGSEAGAGDRWPGYISKAGLAECPHPGQPVLG